MIGEQLPLSVRLTDSAAFENFIEGPNGAAVAAVKRAQRDVLLVGAAGSGKSHLLRAALRAVQHADGQLAYVPLREDAALLPLSGDAALLAVDELEHIDGAAAMHLLRLLDRRRSRQRPTLMASRLAADRLNVPPDLRTRLMQATVFVLAPLDDAAREALLIQRARTRGLRLPPEVARWLLTQLPRDPGSLVTALDALDLASLAAQRRLTIPFVQQALLDARLPTT